MKIGLIACWLMVVSFCVQAFGLDDLSTRLQQPQAVEGAFVQERYLAGLAKPLRTEGQFVLQPGQALLWQMNKPFTQQLRVRADGIWQWRAGQWQKNTATEQQRQMQLFLDLLGGHAQGLQQHFDVQLHGTAQSWRLVLVPKTVLMKQIFSRIEIQGDDVVRQMTLLEKQGDKTVTRFHTIQINPILRPEVRHALAG